jgi:hypothetical protein
LIAAHSAVTAGHDVTILSVKRRSPTFGAMYLHAPIPGITPNQPDMTIEVEKTGTREGYAENVYGDPTAPVSWDRFERGPTPGWSLPYVYNRLWDMYADLIVHTHITPELIIQPKYDKIFSTLPATAICEDFRHKFDKATIIVFHAPTKREGNTMWYNGSRFDGAPKWYRHSVISGHESWEFARSLAPKRVNVGELIKGLRVDQGIKPLRTTCDCHPNVIRIGRFGKWDKNTFTHHGYMEVRDAL